MITRHYIKLLSLLFATVFTAACDIVDDIPYPTVRSVITAFEVEGQCGPDGVSAGTTAIDKEEKLVTLFVTDTVDISKLRITRMEVSNNAEITPDSAVCDDPQLFPKKSFTEVPPRPANTIVDASHPMYFNLHTYQDYGWTVVVQQVINRKIEVENQIGETIIDEKSHNILIYVNRLQNLHDVTIKEFTLGQHAVITPEIRRNSTLDLYTPQTIFVKHGWKDTSEKWTIIALQTDEKVRLALDANGLARNRSITVSGSTPSDVNPTIEYKRADESGWKILPQTDITRISPTRFTATIKGLEGATAYNVRALNKQEYTETLNLTTCQDLQLENPSFDNWHLANDGKTWLPWADNEKCYWDTGNHGATTVGESNSTPQDANSTGKGMSARLQSKYIVIKFAAGNIFTGEYLETDGSNGILGFGRPFTAFPTQMSFDYKFKSSTITRPAKPETAWNEAYSRYLSKETFFGLLGKPDSCQVYIALIGDQDVEEYKGEKYPYVIRTRPSTLHLFDPNSSNVIGYAQMTTGDDATSWTTKTLNINYRRTDIAPKYVIVVASASKYGDYFAGGEQTLLEIDNFRLNYQEQ